MAVTSGAQLVETVAERFRAAETEFHRAYWEAQIEANAENDRRREERELAVRELKGDPSTFSAVQSALEEDIHDPIVKRQLDILALSLTANQMSEEDRLELVRLASATESRFASFRPSVDGKSLSENDIDQILRTSVDEDHRRAAWLGAKQIGHLIAGQAREIARLRNKVARDLGYTDFYRMSLDLQELAEEWLFARLGDLEEATQAPFKKWKTELDDSLKARFGVGDLQPWHYSDPFFQHAPPEGRLTLDHLFDGVSAEDLARKTFAGFGIDISGVLERSDLYPRDLKCQHAFCLDVDRSGDIRILANIVPGERWIEVLLHESGHAAYDAMVDPDLPWVLRRAAHTFVTEGIAIFSGDLVRDPGWLSGVAGIPVDDIRPLQADLRAARAAQKLVFCRWGLVMCHFERELYSDPEMDLDARWWELVERFQGLTRPAEAPEGSWASKIHLATAPVYYHNYLLGEMLAAQLRALIKAECGDQLIDKRAGELLADRIFRHGQLMRWDSLLESSIGSRLSATAFVDSL